MSLKQLSAQEKLCLLVATVLPVLLALQVALAALETREALESMWRKGQPEQMGRQPQAVRTITMLPLDIATPHTRETTTITATQQYIPTDMDMR